MKQIEVSDVVNISIITVEGKSKILLILSNKKEYYANGDIETVKDVYYCHYGYTIWSN